MCAHFLQFIPNSLTLQNVHPALIKTPKNSPTTFEEIYRSLAIYRAQFTFPLSSGFLITNFEPEIHYLHGFSLGSVSIAMNIQILVPRQQFYIVLLLPLRLDAPCIKKCLYLIQGTITIIGKH